MIRLGKRTLPERFFPITDAVFFFIGGLTPLLSGLPVFNQNRCKKGKHSKMRENQNIESTASQYDPQQVIHYLKTLDNPVVEVRIFRKDRYMDRKWTGDVVAGYYDTEHFEKLSEDIQPYAIDPSTEAIYTTIQRLHTDAIYRISNRLKTGVKNQELTSDSHVIGFSLFPIDVDPPRMTGISSSEDELGTTKAKARRIADALAEIGIPTLHAMSGNGCHINALLEVLENTEENAKRFKALGDRVAAHFDTDTTIYNPSRIFKLYGTYARKGDDTSERPHRQAWIHIENPQRITFEELESKLDTILPPVTDDSNTDSAQSDRPQKKNATGRNRTLKEWLDDHGIQYTEKPYKYGHKYQMICPFDATHTSPDAACYESPNGWQFKCSHNSCKGRKWAEFRAKVAPQEAGRSNSRKKSGRPSNAEKANSVEVPETLRGKPVVMLQEISNRDGKDVIDERSRNLVSDDVAQHVLRTDNPHIYRRGLHLGILGYAENGLLFEGLDKYSIGYEITKMVSLVRFTDGMPTPIANPPLWIASDILKHKKRVQVPQVKAILTHPFYNGTQLIDRYGYDAESQVFVDFDEPDLFDLDTDAHTAEDDVNLWRELLKDFPFKDESDFQNAIGYMLTLIIRQGLNMGEMPPLFCITAPREGIGKSLLTKVMIAAVIGDVPTDTDISPQQSNMSMEIGVILRSGSEYIIFDNVDPKRKMDIGELARAITEPKHKFRLPHTAEEVSYENKSVVVYTGSNVELTPELAKRMVAVRLADPGIAEKDRQVHVEGILHYVLENRHIYGSALLRMVKRWIDTGAAEAEKTTHRLRQWSRVIRGIMEANGFGDAFLENSDVILLQANPEHTIWTNAFNAIADELGDKAFEGWTTGDVFKILSYEQQVYAHENDIGRNFTRLARGESILNEIIGADGNDQARLVKLGTALRSKVGTVFAGYELVDLHRSYRNKKMFTLKHIARLNDKPDTQDVSIPTNGTHTTLIENVIDAIDGSNANAPNAMIQRVCELTSFDAEEATDLIKELVAEKRIEQRPQQGEMCYFRGTS